MSTTLTKIDMSQVPDFLKDEKSSGINGLDQSDFRVPRIKLLQPLSPEVRDYPGVAIPNVFWHTGANKSLGAEFECVMLNISKRVILWAPRDTGGGLLAYSNDSKYWASGGNTEFQVKLKGKKELVTWRTGKDVEASGLMEWGSSDPDDEKSAPAASLVYEYIMFLPGTPELSPCTLSLYRTGVRSAKQLNTSLLMVRKPPYCIKVRVGVKMEQSGSDTWSVPAFNLNGYVDKPTYEVTKALSERYEDYKPEIQPDEEMETTVKKNVDDNIPF